MKIVKSLFIALLYTLLGLIVGIYFLFVSNPIIIILLGFSYPIVVYIIGRIKSPNKLIFCSTSFMFTSIVILFIFYATFKWYWFMDIAFFVWFIFYTFLPGAILLDLIIYLIYRLIKKAVKKKKTVTTAENLTKDYGEE